MEGFPGWQTDPTGRHQERYFNSEGVPTKSVRNDGLESIDEGPSAMGTSAPVPTDDIVTNAVPPSVVSPVAANQPPETASLVASYRAPMVEAPDTQVNAADEALPATSDSHSRATSAQLVAHSFACVLAVLLIVASVIAVQQHNVANKWMDDYNAEVKDYHGEVHKNAALYATLVSTQSQLSAVSNQKERH